MTCMDKATQEYISGIQYYMCVTTEMTPSEAYQFAFRCWQHKEWLKQFVNKNVDEPIND